MLTPKTPRPSPRASRLKPRLRALNTLVFGSDFLLPYHDDANGAQLFNTYARFTELGVLKGTGTWTYDMGTLVIGPSNTTWVSSGTQLVKAPFALVP